MGNTKHHKEGNENHPTPRSHAFREEVLSAFGVPFLSWSFSKCDTKGRLLLFCVLIKEVKRDL